MELIGSNPGRKAILYFAAAIMVGAIVLALPISAEGQRISFLDAFFTSTSAVCVTGLTVVDTGHAFSRFGQAVILLLIQAGGIGIMTFASALFVMAGARLSFHDHLEISSALGKVSRIHSGKILKAVILTCAIFEFFGATILYFRFRTMFGEGDAAFHALFHSVSAFCNAGFSTFSNSLEAFSGDPFTIFIFSFLIICGGLGFIVIAELYERFRNRRSRLSLHTKICLTTTVILIVVGTLGLSIAESENLLQKTGIGHGIINCFFQAVTARTAGFNTISQPSFTEVSLLLTIILMFIGGCPGSTAGGVKATTVAIILMLGYNRFIGRTSVSAFKRSISPDSVSRATTVALLAFIFITFMCGLLMFAGERPLAHKLSHGWFVDNVFEAVSAFGTVGLSLGMTGHLHATGKYLIILTMFIGRVGLLTLAFVLARPPVRGEVVYTDEPVMTG